MITQKQVKAWIPSTVAQFTEVMPPCEAPLPEIVVASEAQLPYVREELIEKVQADWKDTEFSFIMELLHGDRGDAILINQRNLLDPKKHQSAEGEFRHFLWHELGHYFAIHNECPSDNLYRFMKPGLAQNRDAQEGYWLWKEFIAESISFYVEAHTFPTASIDTKTWKPAEWRYVSRYLQQRLSDTFGLYRNTLSEEDMGFYFANILMGPATKAYIQAANDGRLLDYDDLFHLTPVEKGSFDPTHITDLPETFQPDFLEIQAILTRQVSKEQFWSINIGTLEELGECINQLTFIKGLGLIFQQ